MRGGVTMQFFSHALGDEIEIPSLQRDGNYLMVSNEQDMKTLITAMGWKDEKDFQESTETDPIKLVGKFFCTLMGIGVLLKGDVISV